MFLLSSRPIEQQRTCLWVWCATSSGVSQLVRKSRRARSAGPRNYPSTLVNLVQGQQATLLMWPRIQRNAPVKPNRTYMQRTWTPNSQAPHHCSPKAAERKQVTWVRSSPSSTGLMVAWTRTPVWQKHHCAQQKAKDPTQKQSRRRQVGWMRSVTPFTWQKEMTVIQLMTESRPWSNSMPRGVALPVLRACLPSRLSNTWYRVSRTASARDLASTEQLEQTATRWEATTSANEQSVSKLGATQTGTQSSRILSQALLRRLLQQREVLTKAYLKAPIRPRSCCAMQAINKNSQVVHNQHLSLPQQQLEFSGLHRYHSHQRGAALLEPLQANPLQVQSVQLLLQLRVLLLRRTQLLLQLLAPAHPLLHLVQRLPQLLQVSHAQLGLALSAYSHYQLGYMLSKMLSLQRLFLQRLLLQGLILQRRGKRTFLPPRVTIAEDCWLPAFQLPVLLLKLDDYLSEQLVLVLVVLHYFKALHLLGIADRHQPNRVRGRHLLAERVAALAQQGRVQHVQISENSIRGAAIYLNCAPNDHLNGQSDSEVGQLPAGLPRLPPLAAHRACPAHRHHLRAAPVAEPRPPRVLLRPDSAGPGDQLAPDRRVLAAPQTPRQPVSARAIHRQNVTLGVAIFFALLLGTVLVFLLAFSPLSGLGPGQWVVVCGIQLFQLFQLAGKSHLIAVGLAREQTWGQLLALGLHGFLLVTTPPQHLTLGLWLSGILAATINFLLIKFYTTATNLAQLLSDIRQDFIDILFVIESALPTSLLLFVDCWMFIAMLLTARAISPESLALHLVLANISSYFYNAGIVVSGASASAITRSLMLRAPGQAFACALLSIPAVALVCLPLALLLFNFYSQTFTFLSPGAVDIGASMMPMVIFAMVADSMQASLSWLVKSFERAGWKSIVSFAMVNAGGCWVMQGSKSLAQLWGKQMLVSWGLVLGLAVVLRAGVDWNALSEEEGETSKPEQNTLQMSLLG